MKPVLLMAALASVLAAAIPSAQAASVTKQIEVTANIEPFCAVITFDLAFGNYGTANISGGIDLDAQTAVYVICPNGTPYTVALDGGLNTQPLGAGDTTICDTGGPAPARIMSSVNLVGGGLGYELYTDPARSDVWGCSPASVQSGTGNGTTNDEFIVYGSVPAGTITLADSYADTVTVTVAF